MAKPGQDYIVDLDKVETLLANIASAVTKRENNNDVNSAIKELLSGFKNEILMELEKKLDYGKIIENISGLNDLFNKLLFDKTAEFNKNDENIKKRREELVQLENDKEILLQSKKEIDDQTDKAKNKLDELNSQLEDAILKINDANAKEELIKQLSDRENELNKNINELSQRQDSLTENTTSSVITKHIEPILRSKFTEYYKESNRTTTYFAEEMFDRQNTRLTAVSQSGVGASGENSTFFNESRTMSFSSSFALLYFKALDIGFVYCFNASYMNARSFKNCGGEALFNSNIDEIGDSAKLVVKELKELALVQRTDGYYKVIKKGVVSFGL